MGINAGVYVTYETFLAVAECYGIKGTYSKKRDCYPVLEVTEGDLEGFLEEYPEAERESSQWYFIELYDIFGHDHLVGINDRR